MRLHTPYRGPAKPVAVQTAQGGPNILVLMVDELNVAATGAYGHPFVHTPNLDRLARSGVTVERAYCNSPLCVPSRAAFMTGRHPHRLGVYDLASPLSSGEPTWAHLFNAAGYETVLAGKMHFIGPDQRHGFERRLVEDCHGDGTHHGVPNWDAPHPAGVSKTGPSERLVKAGRAGRTRYTDYDTSVRDETVSYLREHSQRQRHARQGGQHDEQSGGPRAKPFALCASFISPHFPLVVEDRFFNRYYPDLADLPRHPEVPNHPKYPRLRQFFSLNAPLDEDVIRRCRAAYYGLVTFVDELIGGILDALEETGLAENTFILFTGDHGEMLGERGLWWKSCMLEGAARVPMICALPGRLATGARRDSVLSLVDVFPTLLDVAGIPCPDFLEGNSFLPLLESGDPTWKDEALIEFLAHTAIGPEAALVSRTRNGGQTAVHKFIYALHEPSQLFDLTADPDELVDLSADPCYRGIGEDLERRLLSRWPAERLDIAVRESQRLRRFVAAGQEKKMVELEA